MSCYRPKRATDFEKMRALLFGYVTAKTEGRQQRMVKGLHEFSPTYFRGVR